MEQRKKEEIGLKVLRHRIRESGVHLSKNTNEEFEKTAEELDIPVDELKEFFKEIIIEEFSEILK